MQARTLIALKFSIQKGSPKEKLTIKFGANPMNGSGYMTNYSGKKKDRLVVMPTG